VRARTLLATILALLAGTTAYLALVWWGWDPSEALTLIAQLFLPGFVLVAVFAFLAKGD
jgi:hypothetical protein